MVSFEIFVKSMPPSLPELKVTTSFCFAFKIINKTNKNWGHISKIKYFMEQNYQEIRIPKSE